MDSKQLLKLRASFSASFRCRHCIDLCSRLLVGSVDVGHTYDHWGTFGDLEKSCFAGCDLCALLRQRLLFGFLKSRHWPGVEYEFVLQQSRPYESLRSDHLGVEQVTQCFGVRCNTGQWWVHENLHFVVGIGVDSVQANAAIAPQLPINSSARVEQVVDECGLDQAEWPRERQYHMIREWIKDCTEQHRCSTPLDSSFSEASIRSTPSRDLQVPVLPTRVIDIGGTADVVHLVESNGQRAHYMTLSYCWGEGPHEYVTTTSNYDQRLSRFAISSLPKTIREAVMVARKLGTRYLWVDALCILQPTAAHPDLSDWEREATQMAAVYENSSCTIAASGAENNDGGCFTGRPVSQFTVSPCSAVDKSSGKTLIIEQEDPDWHHTVGHAPLGRRAWVLQEDLLSPRTVYWSKFGLFWECRQLRASEHDITGESLNGSGVFGWANKKKKAMRQITHQPPSDISWLRIIERYSTSELTRATDKLVAVSGMARVLQRQTGDQYVAGLWRSNLIQGLAWYSSGDEHGRYDEIVAPSWSWASVAGQIWWPSAGDLGDVGKHVWDATVDEAEVGLTGPDPLGQVTDGRVRITGYMGTIFVGSRVGVSLKCFCASDFLEAHPTIGPSTGETGQVYAVIPAPPVGHDPTKFGRIHFDVVPLSPSLECQVECLQLSTWHSDQAQRARDVHGLLLRSTGRITGEYTRIGYYILPVDRTFSFGTKRTVDLV